MVLRWIPCVALLLAVGAPLPAGDKKADPFTPTVVIRVRSVDSVLDNAKLLMSVVGKEELGLQLQGLIKSKIGPKGLEGIDPGRPFGFYGHVSAELNATGVLMVPITNEAAVLKLLENLEFPVKKGKDDIYTVTPTESVKVYFRFANKYAYVTALTTDSLDRSKLLEPAKVFRAQDTSVVSALLRLEQIPMLAKKMAMGGIQNQLDKVSEKQPGETDAQHKFRLETQKEIVTVLQRVVDEGSELSVDVDIQPKTKEFTANLSLSGKPKSELAANIAKLGTSKSLFAGVKIEDALMAGRLHVVIPEDVRKVVQSILAEESKKGLANIGNEAKRKQAEEFLKALADNFKSGEIDGVVFFSGPGKDKHYNLLAGLKLPEGEKLGKLIHSLAKELLKELPEVERKKIELDADSVGKTKIHRIHVQAGFDAQAKAIFGDHPLHVAFRSDGVFLALGENGLANLKNALSTQPAAGPPVHLEVNVARLAPLIAKTGAQRAAIARIFPDGDTGAIRLSVEGGDALRVRFSARLSVLQFFNAFATAKKE